MTPKKRYQSCLAFMLGVCLLLSGATWAESPLTYDPSHPLSLTAEHLYADSCILMDAHTGAVLFEKDADTKRSPASTTKVMTLLLALRSGNPRRMVKIPACVEDIALDSTRVPVYTGEEMPFMDLMYGLIFKSGNDAANAIAEIVSGSVDAFVEEMNAYAAAIGMTHTRFSNPHGYTQDEHRTTARDMAILTQHALDNDAFREIVFGRTYTMAATSLRDPLTLSHVYAITDATSPYYYRYAKGIKTGYTLHAGQCYIGAAQRNGQELICVILHCGWTKPEKWIDAKRLFSYGFETLAARTRSA